MYRYQFLYFDKPNDVEEWHNELKGKAAKGNKQARIIVNQIAHCMEMAKLRGTMAPSTIFKKLDGLENLYELLPGDYRIFCCQWQGDKYIMLSHYPKDDNKTRKAQLLRAEQRRDDWIRRYSS